jgi:type I restriction enzyme, S subunit
MSERVPEGWKLQPLSALADYHNGRAFKPEDWSKEGLPIVRIAQINDPFRETDYYIGSDVLDRHLIRKGDLVFSWSATLKAILWKEYDAVLNQHIFKVIEKPHTSRIFLQQLLENSIEKLAESSHGSTMKHIKKGVLDEFHCPIPPLPEQKKIASILTSVDEVIEKTQSQIDKLQDLKKGTMNELLTKGIGHTEFKDSELGRIPKSWEEMTLGAAVQKNIITDIQDGNHGAQHPKASDYVKDGIPFVMASNLKGGVIDVESANKIPREIYENLRIGFAKTGDVLLTHKATIGLVATVNEDTPEVMCTPQVTYYRIGSKDKLRSSFLFYWFQSDPFQNEIVRLSGQSTRDYIGITAQKNLLVRIPPMGEQVEIIKILESIDHNLFIKKHSLWQNQSLKKSLMQDLLTGKVRVSVN